MRWFLLGLVVFLALVVIYDVLQRRHTILHNYPIVGHFRYILEAVGPELRQYIVTGNDEERPFSRDQRRWVYASSKRENNTFGFGTDNPVEEMSSYVIVKHSAFPLGEPDPGPDGRFPVPCAKVLGGWRGRKNAFRPASIVNTSAMSYGSLSGNAVAAINRGAKMAGCWQNTGEGGISSHHDQGGDLLWQIGTGYFGCRDAHGNFDLDKLVDRAARYPVRAIEIKLSQGAKPGKGGILPGVKVTPEIAGIRDVPVWQTVHSPPAHSALHDVDGMLDLIETIADRTGLPVGIKSAVGDLEFWEHLAERIAATGKAPDHIQIDGGEGGTGAAPLVFADHVALPFKIGFARVYRVFVEHGLHDHIVFIGSGKLGFPANGLLALAMGCDLLAVAREAMLSIGCIQAQRCHTGNCPTGVTSNKRWLMAGLDPTLKAARFANYIATLRHDLMALAHATGVPHPSLVPLDRFEILDGHLGGRSATEVFGLEPAWGLPPHLDEVRALCTPAPAGGGHGLAG